MHITHPFFCPGACNADFKAFCKDVGPGDGRLAKCLSKRVKAQKQGNVVGGWHLAFPKHGTLCRNGGPPSSWPRVMALPVLFPAGRKVSAKCIEEIGIFKIDRSSNINKDVPLGEPIRF